MDVPDPISPNYRLRQERLRRSWRQQELADKLGTTPVTISRWEAGSQQPSLYFREKLCTLFDNTPEELGLAREVLHHKVTVRSDASPPAEPLTTSDQLPANQQGIAPKDTSDEEFTTSLTSSKQKHRRAQTPELSSCTQTPLFRSSSVEQQNRERLIRRVQSFWITGVLEQSLHQAALITLDLQDAPEAVENPWRLVMQDAELESTPFPTGTRITKIYDLADGELLILGEPGAGKTTLLLELARDLLHRAQQTPDHPLPVIFNLSSWAQKRQPLTTWLLAELESKYQVPREIGSTWIDTQQLLPLLDGLDEMDATYRAACIQAINTYHQAHHLVPLVVCSRTNEYMAQPHHLTYPCAVTIQPLTTEQVNEYFTRIGQQTASLQLAFQQDAVLQELVTTPLMLTILILAYQDSSLEEITDDVSSAVPQQHIFATYTQRMLCRRSARSPYSQQRTIHWLSYLAKQMKQQGHAETVFYLEHMQPTWLTKKWQRRLYAGLTVGSLCGLLAGLANIGTFTSLKVIGVALLIGLLFGLLSEPAAEKEASNILMRAWMRIRQTLATLAENRLMIGVTVGFVIGIVATLNAYLLNHSHEPFANRIAIALWSGLLDGIYAGLPFGLILKLERRIEPVEAFGWSWMDIQSTIAKWLRVSIAAALTIGLIFSLPWLSARQHVWFVMFLLTGLLIAFYLLLVIIQVSGITQGLARRSLDISLPGTPNQGIWRSAQYGAKVATVAALLTAMMVVANAFLVDFWLPSIGISTRPPASAIDIEIVNMMSHILQISPTTQQMFWTLQVLFLVLRDGATLGLAAGLYCGGAAYVQHFVLRFLLWCARYLPFNYPRFLDYATERILLRKVGGGYIFVHRLLLEYFASLEL